jgi:hypothetical protein
VLVGALAVCSTVVVGADGGSLAVGVLAGAEGVVDVLGVGALGVEAATELVG